MKVTIELMKQHKNHHNQGYFFLRRERDFDIQTEDMAKMIREALQKACLLKTIHCSFWRYIKTIKEIYIKYFQYNEEKTLDGIWEIYPEIMYKNRFVFPNAIEMQCGCLLKKEDNEMKLHHCGQCSLMTRDVFGIDLSNERHIVIPGETVLRSKVVISAKHRIIKIYINTGEMATSISNIFGAVCKFGSVSLCVSLDGNHDFRLLNDLLYNCYHDNFMDTDQKSISLDQEKLIVDMLPHLREFHQFVSQHDMPGKETILKSMQNILKICCKHKI